MIIATFSPFQGIIFANSVDSPAILSSSMIHLRTFLSIVIAITIIRFASNLLAVLFNLITFSFYTLRLF